MKKSLQLLLDFAISETERGNDTFFCYSPHVNMVEIYSYGGKWSSEKEKRVWKQLWDTDITIENAKLTINDFKSQLHQLNK